MTAHDPSIAEEADVELYTRGSCHAFALALHRNLGMGLLVVTDPSTDYGSDDDAIPSVVHVLALDGHGNAWDVLGRRSHDRVRDEILARHPDVDRVSFDACVDESGLIAYVDGTGEDPDLDRPLHALADDDVDEAWDCACRVLSEVPCFPLNARIGTRP